MSLYQPLNDLRKFANEPFIGKKAFIHFSMKDQQDENSAAKDLGYTPTKGKYIMAQILVFHTHKLEHRTIVPENPQQPHKFHLEHKHTNGKKIELEFNHSDESELRMTILNVWIHEDFSGYRFRFRAIPPFIKKEGAEELIWDTIFCEADVPDI